MRSDDSRRPGRRAAAAPAPDAPRGGAGGSATSPSSSGIPRPRPVPLWHSLRLRIAAGVAAVAIGVSGVAGAVVDNAAAVDGRERLRAQALERLESAVIFYDARGLTRFGAVLDDPGLPAGMAERAVPEQRATFYDGTTMYAAQRINPRDVLLVDVMMPRMDGMTFVRRARERVDTPAVLLTARDLPYDQIAGFEAGADDYVTKPFDGDALAARLRAVLRRGRTQSADSEIALGDLRIDRPGMVVSRGEERISLSSKEFRLLEAFLDHPGRVLSRIQLLDLVWGDPDWGDPHVVEVTVQRLRAKIGAAHIATVRGAGYKLVKS